MPDKQLHILLVEDNPADADLLTVMLTEVLPGRFTITHVESLSEAVDHSRQTPSDIVLLDMSLPDSFGLSTVVRACQEMGNSPVVVLSGTEAGTAGLGAIQAGAQDYLVKGRIDHDLLSRALRYAVVRHSKQDDMRVNAMTDELTGLYNRRGLLTLLEQLRQTADRTLNPLLLLFADLDKLKHINDTGGHNEGDRALQDTADMLRQTFRASDLLGRFGGDEFLIAVPNAGIDSFEMLKSRLDQNVRSLNATANRPYCLSLSVGAVEYHPNDTRSLETLLEEADSLMYHQKRQKQAIS